MDRPGVVDYPGDVDGDENKDAFLALTNCPAVITEAYFLDNESERNRFSGDPVLNSLIGKASAEGLDDWWRRSL